MKCSPEVEGVFVCGIITAYRKLNFQTGHLYKDERGALNSINLEQQYGIVTAALNRAGFLSPLPSSQFLGRSGIMEAPLRFLTCGRWRL